MDTTPHWEIALLLNAWRDLDQAIEDVTTEDILRQIDGGSSIAWTIAHVTYVVDSWINVRFQGLELDAVTANPRFGFGGDGGADDVGEILRAVNEVRQRAVTLLLDSTIDLDRTVAYNGSYQPFRTNGMQLRAAIVQSAAHHIFHLGEIVTRRGLMGYETDTFPGPFLDLIRQ